VVFDIFVFLEASPKERNSITSFVLLNSIFSFLPLLSPILFSKIGKIRKLSIKAQNPLSFANLFKICFKTGILGRSSVNIQRFVIILLLIYTFFTL
jgi:hypothetical protein